MKSRKRKKSSEAFFSQVNMSEKNKSVQENIYQIKIKGSLDESWAIWFDGLEITLDNENNTLLTGPVRDDAALHGLLKKIRDLALSLISVNIVKKGG